MKQKNGMLKLKDLADITVRPWNPGMRSDSGRFPYIGLKGEGGFCDTANFDADSIIVTRFGSGSGRVFYFSEPGYASGCIVLRGKTPDGTRFLYRYLKERACPQASVSPGSSVPQITVKAAENFKIDIPFMNGMNSRP